MRPMQEREILPTDEYQVKETINETAVREPEGVEMHEADLRMPSELRGVSINPLSSGYMVKVGCQSVAVETTETLLKMLDKYLNDPDGFERKWYSKDVRNRLENII